MRVQNENKNVGILSLVDISLNWQMLNTTIKKTHTVLVHGHVYIGAKIQIA